MKRVVSVLFSITVSSFFLLQADASMDKKQIQEHIEQASYLFAKLKGLSADPHAESRYVGSLVSQVSEVDQFFARNCSKAYDRLWQEAAHTFKINASSADIVTKYILHHYTIPPSPIHAALFKLAGLLVLGEHVSRGEGDGVSIRALQLMNDEVSYAFAVLARELKNSISVTDKTEEKDERYFKKRYLLALLALVGIGFVITLPWWWPGSDKRQGLGNDERIGDGQRGGHGGVQTRVVDPITDRLAQMSAQQTTTDKKVKWLDKTVGVSSKRITALEARLNELDADIKRVEQQAKEGDADLLTTLQKERSDRHNELVLLRRNTSAAIARTHAVLVKLESDSRERQADTDMKVLDLSATVDLLGVDVGNQKEAQRQQGERIDGLGRRVDGAENEQKTRGSDWSGAVTQSLRVVAEGVHAYNTSSERRREEAEMKALDQRLAALNAPSVPVGRGRASRQSARNNE